MESEAYRMVEPGRCGGQWVCARWCCFGRRTGGIRSPRSCIVMKVKSMASMELESDMVAFNALLLLSPS